MTSRKSKRERADFYHWRQNHPLLSQFMAEALAYERERRNNKRWIPTLLNGSSAMSDYVDKKMRPLWEKEKG
jgi:hypothetical protein